MSNTQAGQLERIQSGVANGTISAREATKLLEQQAQAAQIGSLAQGIRSGDLSSNESTTLLQGQANIARNIANAQAEGHVSLFEKLHTGILQEAAGRDIRSQKIDLERAPHAHPRFTIDV